MNINEVLTLTASKVEGLSEDRLLGVYVTAKNYIEDSERLKPSLQKWLELSEKKITLSQSKFEELRNIKKEAQKDVAYLKERNERMKQAFAVISSKSEVLKRTGQAVCPDFSELILRFRFLKGRVETLNNQLNYGLTRKENLVRQQRELLENTERRRQCARIINERDLNELDARIASYEEKNARAVERLVREKRLLEEERERKRLDEEKQRRKLAKEQERQRLAEEEERQRIAEEQERQRLEEEERQRVAEEQERQRLEEEERRRKEEERLEEEREQQRVAEEAERRRLEEEKEQQERDRQRWEEESRKQCLEEEQREQKRLEEEHKKQRLEEEAARQRLEEELEHQRLEAEREQQRLEEERQRAQEKNRTPVVTDKKLEECQRWAEISQDRRRAKNKKTPVKEARSPAKAQPQRKRQIEAESRRQENARKAKEAKTNGLTALPRHRLPTENRIQPADTNLDETLEYMPGEFM